MTKRAQLADGRILEFPDNTPLEVIQRVVRQQIATGQKAAAKPVDPAVTKRRAELDAEEKAAREKLARATKQAEEYRNTFIGKALAAPYHLFGAKSTSEERLEEFGQDTKETIDRINRERAYLERKGRVAPKPTAGERALGALKAIPRGAIESGSQFLGTLGIGGGEGEQAARAMEQRGKKFAENLGLGASETAEFDPLQRNLEMFGGGLGSLLPYVGAEVVGRKVAPLTKAAPYIARGAQAVLGTGQGASQARQQMDEFERQTGQKIDPTTRKLVQAGGATIGLSELLPVGRMLNTLPAPVREATTNRISGILTKLGADKLAPDAARAAIRETVQAVESKAVGRIATRGFAPEALQEGGTQLAQNVLAAGAYNPNQDLMEGVAENALVGGLTGATVRGGVEAASVLGAKEAPKGTVEPDAKPLESVEIAIPSTDDPNIINRERVEILSAPDADGNIVIRRADGKPRLVPVEALDSMRIPEEGGFIPSDAFSGEMIYGRLKDAAGAEADRKTAGFTDALNRKLSNNLALGRVQDAADYISNLEKRFSGVRKRQAAMEAAKGGVNAVQDPTLRVLFEAKSILNDYRVEYAKQQAQPGVTVGEAAPAPTETLAQILERNQAARDEESVTRDELLQQVINDPNIADKPGTYEDMLADYGLEDITPDERSTLMDVMRTESAYETAAGIDKTQSIKAQQAERADLIEGVLGKRNLNTDQKISVIEAELLRARQEPLAEREIERIQKRAFSEDVFGPTGELAATEAEEEVPAEFLAAEDAFEAGVPAEEAMIEPEAVEPEVPVTKVEPGVARGVKPVERGTQGVVKGRPVEGAAELTAGMQDEQELTKRLNNMRNNNLISDRDIGEVLSLIRVPESQEALNALPTAQRDRWMQVLDLTRDMNAKAEQRDVAKGKEKAQLNAAVKALDSQIDAVRSQLAKYAMGEAALRVEKRKADRAQIEEDYKSGEINRAERDRQLSELRVDKPLAPRMAEKDITGAKTEAAKKFLDAAKRTRSSRAVLQAVADEGGPLGEVAQRLLAFAPDTRILVVDPGTLRLAARNTGQALDTVPDMEGVWVPKRNAIYLSSEMATDHTPVHEAIHPILDLHIEQGTDEGRAITDIFEMYKELASPEQRDAYGFRDAHEFASEVWGNEQFRQLLRDLTPQPTKADPKPRSLLRRIFDAFASIIRKEAKTDADAAPVIDYIEQVMQLTESAAAKPLRGEGKARAIESQLRENPNNSRAGQVGIMARLQQLKKQYAKARSDIARKLNYKYQDVVDYDRQLAAIYGVDQLPDNMAVSHKAELLEASRAGRQVLLDRNYIKPILDKMAALDLDEQDVGMYLWARSAKDRNALVRSRNAEFPEGGSGMTDAEAEAILKDFALRGLTPKLNQLAKMHDRLVDYMLNLRVQEGLLTRKQADAARKAQPFYTPLKGYAADGDMQTMGDDNAHNDSEYQRNLGIRRSEYTKSQGRKSMPYNPLDMLFADAKQVIQRASINRVGQQLLDNLIGDPEANADVATYYTDDNPKIRVKPSDNIEYPDGTPVRANMRMERGQYLVVKRNGTPYYIEFANTDAGQALKRAFDNMTPKQLEGFTKFWVKGANTVKSLLTRYSPPYLPRALARDVQDAVANAYAAETDKASPAFGKKLAAKVAAYSTPASKTGRLIDAAITRFVSGTEPGSNDTAEMMLLLEQMMEDGGSPGHSTVHDLELITAEAKEYLARARELKAKDPVRYAKEAPQAVLGALNAASEYIDLKARLATYVAALEAGIDREGAARLALNSSLNLTRRGEWARALDSTFFFFSPAVESARRFKNMALNTSNGRKVIASQLAIGGMLTVWNMLMGSGDDDDDGRPNWMDLPDATKQTSLVIMTGPGSDDYIALPLGFMLSFPAYAGQKLTEAAYGAISPEAASISIADSLTAIPKAAVTTFSPVKPQGEDAQQFVSSFLPNLIKPFGDIVINRNYFGTPIYTEQFDSDRAASSLGREDTGRVWKWIARSLNDMSGGYGSVPGGIDFAPEAYRYFFEAHAGGLYRFGEDTVKFITEDNKDDKTLAQRLPVVRSYVGKGGEYVPMTEYYKNAKKVGALVRQEKYEPEDFVEATDKFPVQADPRVMEAYKVAEKERDRIGRERRDMLLGLKDPEARRDVIDMYRDEERGVFMEFNRTYNEVKAEYQ